MDKDTLKSLRAVYVEDEEAVRQQLTGILKLHLKEVYPAGNGKEGLEFIARHDPDVIITDLEMPVMDGLKLISEVRAKYNHHHPIIVLTGYDDDEHKHDGADCYLYKPLMTRELFEKIYELAIKYGKLKSDAK